MESNTIKRQKIKYSNLERTKAYQALKVWRKKNAGKLKNVDTTGMIRAFRGGKKI